MIQLKNLAAAVALVGVSFAGCVANAEGLGGRFYVEVAGVTSSPDNATAKFSDQNLDATWDLSRMYGASVQIGGDFGHFRTDLKVRGLHGSVDSITGTPGGEPTKADTLLAVATINAYIDVYDIELGESVTLTPYFGAGTGYAHGYMRATLPNDGLLQNEQANDGGRAYSMMVGALIEFADTVGLTAEYEHLDTNLTGFSDANNYSVGLRLTF